MRPIKIIEGLKEGHTPSHLGPILTETLAFSHQRRQGMTKRKIETFNQTGTNRPSHFRQTLSTAANPIHQFLKSPVTLLFDQLSIDQIRVRFPYRFLGTAPLSCARKRLQGMLDLNQSRQITAESITEKARHAKDPGSRHLYQLQGALKRSWTDKPRQDEAKLRSKTDPHPLPPFHVLVAAFPIRFGL